MTRLWGALAVCVLAVAYGFALRIVGGAEASGGFPGSSLTCLGGTTIEGIRSDPNNGLAAAYSTCHDELSKRLANFDFDEWGLKATFAALTAHMMAPYGKSGEIELEALLREQHLDCDNYAALTGHFVRILIPDHPSTFAIIGLDGGKVGNHAQVILRVAEDRRILADPTVGIIAATSYNRLLSGNPVPLEKVEAFYAYNDPEILKFGKTVYDAIIHGSYRPSDMLYYFENMDSFIRFSSGLGKVWTSPPDVDAIAALFPTHGAIALKRELAKTSH
jgi:hypothetical protein